jgi:hypothetical protein
MSLLPSVPRHGSTSPTSGSSTCSTPRAVSSSLAPTDIQTPPPTYSEEEDLRDHRGRHSSDPVQFTDHPTVRVTSTEVEEKSSSLPSSNDFNDRMISTSRNRSRSPGRSVFRDEERDLRPQTSDHPLSHSWWGEEKHVVRPWRDSKKKTEQTEALQSTRIVSNNVIPLWVSSRAASEWIFLRRPDVDQFDCRRITLVAL